MPLITTVTRTAAPSTVIVDAGGQLNPAAASTASTSNNSSAVLILLIIVGLPSTGLMRKLYAVAPATITTSRITTSAASHAGIIAAHQRATKLTVSKSLSRNRAKPPPIDKQTKPPWRGLTKKDVLGHSQLRNNRQFLMDEAETRRKCVMRRTDADRTSINLNVHPVRAGRPRNQLDER